MPTYVQHEVLGKVSDVFNAEALWRSPGLALFARRPLLRDLLERSPREQRGHSATRCFAHVSLLLPQEDVEDDRHLARGARARELAQHLSALHQRDFGDLLGGEDVRYAVSASPALAPGEVEIKFGHAIYLPAPDEQVLYTVSVSRDSAVWKPVCPIYPSQRLTLIGDSQARASHACPLWPFGPEGGLLVVNDGPDQAPELQMRPKDGYEIHFDQVHGYFVVRSRRQGPEAPRLLVKLSRQGAAPSTIPAPPATVWKPRVLAADPTALPPVADDATYAPQAHQGLRLAGLALPRLSSYRELGAQALELGFDANLALTRVAAGVLRLRLDTNDALQAETSAGTSTVNLPAEFTPADGRSLRLLPAPGALAERYSAMLPIESGPSVTLARGVRLNFGRQAPAMAPLRVLDAPHFLQGGSGTADRIGLSRLAFHAEAVDGGIRVARIAPRQALYHLDPALQLVAVLPEGEQSYLLPHGHHLVAGPYVLRAES